MFHPVQTPAPVRGVVHLDHLQDIGKGRPFNLRADRHSKRRLTQTQSEQLGRISLFSGVRVLTVTLSVRRIRDPPCSSGFLLASSATTPLRLIQIAHSTASHCSTPSAPPHSKRRRWTHGHHAAHPSSPLSSEPFLKASLREHPVARSETPRER